MRLIISREAPTRAAMSFCVRLLGDHQLAVLLDRELEQDARHAPVDVEHREAAHVLVQAARDVDQVLDELQRDLGVAQQEGPEVGARQDRELRRLERHHRGRARLLVEHHLAEVLARAP